MLKNTNVQLGGGKLMGGGNPRFITNPPAERAGASILKYFIGFLHTFASAGVGGDVVLLFFMQNPG